jgi:hypothetical protein
MARGQRKQERAAQVAAPAVEVRERDSEPRYPMDVWLENCRALLGAQRYAVAGAVQGQREPEGGFTKSELVALLGSFSNRPLG